MTSPATLTDYALCPADSAAARIFMSMRTVLSRTAVLDLGEEEKLYEVIDIRTDGLATGGNLGPVFGQSPAVDGDVTAGHESGIVGRQEDD